MPYSLIMPGRLLLMMLLTGCLVLLMSVPMGRAFRVADTQPRNSRMVLNHVTRGYEDIVVRIGPELTPSSCPQILDNVKTSLTAASRSLHSSLDGLVYLDKITIEVPHNWSEKDCRTTLNPGCLTPSGDKNGDILVGEDHPTKGSFPWTQQSQGCGLPGEFLYLPYSFIRPSNSSQLGSIIANQFMRLRYGVFEDYDPRLSGLSVTSRHHALCRGRGVKEVIKNHADFLRVGATKKTASQEEDDNLSFEEDDIRMTTTQSTRRKIGYRSRKGYQGGRLPAPTGVLRLQPVNFTVPRFSVTRQAVPRYVIVLENSQVMNMRDQWSFIQTASKKFITHDLPEFARVGLVLFNEDAYEAYSLSLLGPKQSDKRNGLAYSINNKYNLSPSMGSCVRCGIEKALETLKNGASGGNSGSGGRVASLEGAVLIVISRGSLTSLSLEDEKSVLALSLQHNLRIFSISLPQSPMVDVSLSLERIAFATGGESFFLLDDSDNEKSSLSTYVELIDTFREIQRRTGGNAPDLLYEKQYEPHTEGVYQEQDHFIVDRYAGGQTDFNVFALKPMESCLKSMALQDKRGRIFNRETTELANFNILSIFNVPFSAEENIGMNWTYNLERLPSPEHLNSHVVTVTSQPRDPTEQITIRLWTNLNRHAVSLTANTPVILYAEVKLGHQAPVNKASVTAEITAVNQTGYRTTDPLRLELLDNGNGDPDIASGDGIYSRYLTGVSVEGRYTVRLLVNDNHGQAFAPLKSYGERIRSCCVDPNAVATITNQKLGAFTRIVGGASFRIHSIDRQQVGGMIGLPPARVMDLAARMITAEEIDQRLPVDNNVEQVSYGHIELSWTSPGEDYDAGQPISYSLFLSERPDTFYTDLAEAELVAGVSANKPAGTRETWRIRVGRFDTTQYYAILAVDKEGNEGDISNVVKVFVPSPPAAVLKNQSERGDSSALRSGISAALGDGDVSGTAMPTEKPSRILLYIIVGIVGFILLCLLIVMIILLTFRRKKMPPEDDDDLEHDEDNKSLGIGGSSDNGFSIVGSSEDIEPNGLILARGGAGGRSLIHGDGPEVKHYLLSSSHQDSSVGNNTVGPVHSSLITKDESGSISENPYGCSVRVSQNSHPTIHNASLIATAASAYGWHTAGNPYVYKDLNETYASIGSCHHNSSQDSYVRGSFQPTYAQPIPKNMRHQVQTATSISSSNNSGNSSGNNNNNPLLSQPIYSNAAVVMESSAAARLVSASPHGSHSSIEGSNRVTFRCVEDDSVGNNTATLPLTSSRVSPDSSEGGGSTSHTATPTKSILKKPRPQQQQPAYPQAVRNSLDLSDSSHRIMFPLSGTMSASNNNINVNNSINNNANAMGGIPANNFLFNDLRSSNNPSPRMSEMSNSPSLMATSAVVPLARIMDSESGRESVHSTCSSSDVLAAPQEDTVMLPPPPNRCSPALMAQQRMSPAVMVNIPTNNNNLDPHSEAMERTKEEMADNEVENTLNLSTEGTYLETSFDFAPLSPEPLTGHLQGHPRLQMSGTATLPSPAKLTGSNNNLSAASHHLPQSSWSQEEVENAANANLHQTSHCDGLEAGQPAVRLPQPPTVLPKPKLFPNQQDLLLSSDSLAANSSNNTSMEKKIRSCTQV